MHPRKAEVRFSREKELGTVIIAAIEKVLSENTLVPEIERNKGGTELSQKTFELSGSSGRLQVSESPETFQKKQPERK